MKEDLYVRSGKDHLSGNKAESGFSKVRMRKTWEDDSLPDEFDALKIAGIYMGTDESGFLKFEGLSFSIPKHKLPEQELGGPSPLNIGDEIEVIKLNWQGSDYDGDGIVKVRNLRMGNIADVNTWRKREQEEEKERGKAGWVELKKEIEGREW